MKNLTYLIPEILTFHGNAVTEKQFSLFCFRSPSLFFSSCVCFFGLKKKSSFYANKKLIFFYINWISAKKKRNLKKICWYITEISEIVYKKWHTFRRIFTMSTKQCHWEPQDKYLQEPQKLLRMFCVVDFNPGQNETKCPANSYFTFLACENNIKNGKKDISATWE